MNNLKRLTIALCSLICMGTSAYAQANLTKNPCGGQKVSQLSKPLVGLYKGTIAGLPVVMQLGEENKYFYNKKGIDILLEANIQDQHLILQETDEFETTACFSLIPQGQQLNGTWRKVGSQKTNIVKLTRIQPKQISLKLNKTPFLTKLQRDEPYELFKINTPWNILKNGEVVLEPLSQMKYPRLPRESKALNNALQDLQIQLALNHLSCQFLGRENFYYEHQYSPFFKSHKLISFHTTSSHYCGGGYPSSYVTGITLDRLTGQVLTFQDLFTYLSKPKLQTMYQKQAREKTSPECLNVLSELDHIHFTTSLTKIGMQVTPTDFPNVYKACATSVLIPYAKLEQYIPRSSAYFNEFYK